MHSAENPCSVANRTCSCAWPIAHSPMSQHARPEVRAAPSGATSAAFGHSKTRPVRGASADVICSRTARIAAASSEPMSFVSKESLIEGKTPHTSEPSCSLSVVCDRRG